MLCKLSFLPQTLSFVSISISVGLLSLIINAILIPIVWSEISSVWKEFDQEIQEFRDIESLVTVELGQFPVAVKRKTRESAELIEFKKLSTFPFRELVDNEDLKPHRRHRKIIKRIVHRGNRLNNDDDEIQGAPSDDSEIDQPLLDGNCECKPLDCPVGAPGPVGLPGRSGIDGLQGHNGIPGISPAVLELVSSQRTNCILCPAGPQGMKGNRGYTGWRGMAGYKGVAGMPGRHGFHGKPGEAGDAGKEGEMGRPGEPGHRGMDTHAVVGLPGKKGAVGILGAPGKQGAKGFDANEFGPTGLRGPSGAAGAKGNPGEKGPHGAPGPEGQQGERFCECGIIQQRPRTRKPVENTEEEREIRKSPIHRPRNELKRINSMSPQIALIQSGEDVFGKKSEGKRGYNQSGLVHIPTAMAVKQNSKREELQEMLDNDKKVHAIVTSQEYGVTRKSPFTHYYELSPSVPTKPSVTLPRSSYHQPSGSVDYMKYSMDKSWPRIGATKKKSTVRKHGSATVRAPPIKIHHIRKVNKHQLADSNITELLIDREAKRIMADAIENSVANASPTIKKVDQLQTEQSKKHQYKNVAESSNNAPLLENIARMLANTRAQNIVPIERPIRRSPVSTGSPIKSMQAAEIAEGTTSERSTSRREPLSYANIKLQRNIPPRVLQRHLENMRNTFSIGMVDNST